MSSLNLLAGDVIDAARFVLEDGEFDDCGSFIIRNTYNEESIGVIDDLHEAIRQYDKAVAEEVGAEDPSPEPMSTWQMVEKGINMFFWLAGFIFIAQQAGTALALLAVARGWV